MNVQVQLLTEDAQIPVYSTYGSAGCDIFAVEDFILQPSRTEVRVPEGVSELLTNGLTAKLEMLKEGKITEKDLAKAITAGMVRTLEHAKFNQIRGSAHVKSGIAIGIPKGSNIEMEMRGRSGLAFRLDVDAFNGTIDEDYTQEINIMLYNYTNAGIPFRKGDKICQAVFKQVVQVQFEQVDTINQEVVENKERDNNTSILKVERVGGLGHTGV